MKYHIERMVLILFLWLMATGVQAQTTPVVSMEDSPHFVADGSSHLFYIRIDDVTELFAFSIELSYDPTAIQVQNVFSFDYLSSSSTTGSRTVQYIDYATQGKIIVDEAILGVTPETTTGGRLFFVQYRALQFGVQKEVPIDFTVCLLRDEYNNPISRTVHDGMIYLWYGRAKVKAFLQGPYVAASGNMHTQLRDADYTAQRTSPFTQDPAVFPQQLPAGVVDWVLVQLRQGVTGTILASKSCFLKTDGSVVAPTLSASADIPFGVPSGNYSIIVRHRNHLGIQSANTYTLGVSTPGTYDFTSGMNQAYGLQAMALLTTNAYGLWAGDGDGNGQVSSTDFVSIWFPQNGYFGLYGGDYDLDRRVSATDFVSYWYPANGRVSQIP